MKIQECHREAETLACAIEGREPEQMEASLRAHIDECPVCSEIAAVVKAIGLAREDVQREVVVPDSASVWWRAQLRARREAAEAAAKPIAAAQVIAVAAIVMLLGMCGTAVSAFVPSVREWFGSALASAALTTAIWPENGALLLAIAALLFLVPAAVLVAVGRE